MPPGWIYDQTDRGLYIVQIWQKEKREGESAKTNAETGEEMKRCCGYKNF